MEKRYIYHLTSKNYLDNIKTNGLQPRVGKNSARIFDTKPRIYLCEYHDIPYWKILLNNADVLLRIDINGVSQDDLDGYSYGFYSEIFCTKAIAPEYITRIHLPSKNKHAMEELCMSFLSSISHLTVLCARYYNNRTELSAKELRENIEIILNAIGSLDYSSVSKRKIRKELRKSGDDGLTTFDDYYAISNEHPKRRLWEQLKYYKQDELTDIRTKLYQYIKHTFKSCLAVETGGWTG